MAALVDVCKLQLDVASYYYYISRIITCELDLFLLMQVSGDWLLMLAQAWCELMPCSARP